MTRCACGRFARRWYAKRRGERGLYWPTTDPDLVPGAFTGNGAAVGVVVACPRLACLSAAAVSS